MCLVTALQDHNSVRKVYVARVLGQFPEQPITADTALAWDSGTNHAFLMEADGSMSSQQSLGHVPDPSQRECLQAKTAVTQFKLLSVSADAKTSLVECQPLTGRSHQIRSASPLLVITGRMSKAEQQRMQCAMGSSMVTCVLFVPGARTLFQRFTWQSCSLFAV